MTNEEYATAIQKGNTELAGELWMQIEKFMTAKTFKFFHMYAKPLTACGITLKDLQQESYFVMLEMVKAYKPESNYKLLTYADWQFKNYIKRSVLGLNKDNVFRNALNSASSIDVELTEDTETTLGDTIPDKQAVQDFEEAEHNIFNSELRNALDEAIEQLEANENSVICGRFWDNKTQKQIAVEIGVSGSRTAQLEGSALRKLRFNSKLRSFNAEYIKTKAYKNTSLSSFRSHFASSQELILERLEAVLTRKNDLMNDLKPY